jgi:epoxyqueuosine reductase
LDSAALTDAIKAEAARMGFDHCRVVALSEAMHADFFGAWLAEGRAGEMTYLKRNVDKRRNPALLADSDGPDNEPFRSIIVLAVDYHQFSLPPTIRDDPSRGITASYAWGDDYHEIIRPQLYALDAFIAGLTSRTTHGKCLVDTGPVLERDWAMRAGIGFTGKNCCTIHPQIGSWLLLATVIVPEVLLPDPPPAPANERRVSAEQVLAGLDRRSNWGTWKLSTATGTCGRCTRCLEACPTGAFVGPFNLDPRRCISYWTIEARSPVPRALRSSFGNRIFGCDICQEVCPWNHRLQARRPLFDALHAKPTRMAPPLLQGFAPDTPYWLDQSAFSAQFRRSPVKRAKRAGMLRNVCVALGNWADPSTVPALQQALADEHPLARGHAAWALGQVLSRHGTKDAGSGLRQALENEDNAWVIEEIRLALGI